MAMVFLEQNDVVSALKELKQALIHFRKCGAKHLINLSEEQIKQISKVQSKADSQILVRAYNRLDYCSVMIKSSGRKTCLQIWK
jgi:hypothetical protein